MKKVYKSSKCCATCVHFPCKREFKSLGVGEDYVFFEEDKFRCPKDGCTHNSQASDCSGSVGTPYKHI